MHKLLLLDDCVIIITECEDLDFDRIPTLNLILILIVFDLLINPIHDIALQI
jgi:hypothetical protein